MTVIEVVPLPIQRVLAVSRVVPKPSASKVVRDTKAVINALRTGLFWVEHKWAHIQAFEGELNKSVNF